MRLGQLERRVLQAILDVREEAKPPTKTLAEALEEIRLRAAQIGGHTSPEDQVFQDTVAALSQRKPGRTGVKPSEAALIDVRTHIWRENVTPAHRASLSRALKTLQAKGLVKCRGSHRFIVRLTPEGEKVKLNANKNRKPVFVNVKQEATS